MVFGMLNIDYFTVRTSKIYLDSSTRFGKIFSIGLIFRNSLALILAHRKSLAGSLRCISFVCRPGFMILNSNLTMISRLCNGSRNHG